MSGYLVKRAQSVIHLALEEIVSKQGLGIPHYVVLTLLAETPGLPNAELARKAFVTPQSMNEVLKQLEASGLVERQPESVKCTDPLRSPDTCGREEVAIGRRRRSGIGRASAPGSHAGRSPSTEPIARDDHPEHDSDGVRFTVRHELLPANRQTPRPRRHRLAESHLRIANDQIRLTILCCHLRPSSRDMGQGLISPGGWRLDKGQRADRPGSAVRARLA